MTENNIEDLAFNKAQQLIFGGLSNMDVLQLTDLLIKLQKERDERNDKSDLLIKYNDEIISIEDVGILDTVDISVSGDNLFYCNSILTKNSFGLAATCDLLISISTDDELEKLGQVVFKQLKSRYSNKTKNKKFVVGIDYDKMRMYDVEDQGNLLDGPDEYIDADSAVFDKTNFAESNENRFKDLF
jgi:hypothetical protein